MFLDNALQGAQRGAALTQRMLAFARRQELNLKAVDVALLVRDMMNLLQSSCGSSVQIETRFPLSLPMINADANQLELALLNLAMNARDAMPKGGSITIAAHELTVENDQALNPGRYLCLAVTDTGTGMDENTLLHAIEPFYTTKGVGKGTGLGLPMVHGMAEQSGGKLLLKSSPGKGTTAELCLPVASSEGTALTPTAAAAHAPKIRALTIISVDDDPLVAFNTCAMLEDLGHKVHCVSSGAEALNLLRQYKDIDLLVTDQAMPGMTGSELAKIVKAEWPELAILMATGYAELPDGLGRDIPKLAKPFFQEDLANAIAALRHFSTN